MGRCAPSPRVLAVLSFSPCLAMTTAHHPLPSFCQAGAFPSFFLPFPSSVLPRKSTRGSYFCPSFHSSLDLWGRSVELCLPGLGQHKVFDFLCSHFGLVQAVFTVCRHRLMYSGKWMDRCVSGPFEWLHWNFSRVKGR